MDHVSPRALFWYLAAILAASCLFTLVRMLMRRAPSTDVQSDYVPMPITPLSTSSQGAPELDPRSAHKPR
jgi:hypothetical protein